MLSVSVAYGQNKQIDDMRNKWVPNQVIVKFKDNYQLNNRLMETGKTGITPAFDVFAVKTQVKKVERVFEPNGFFVRRARMRGNPKRYENLTTVTIAGDSMNMKETIKQFQAMPEVEYAEPNYIFSTGNTVKANPVFLSSLAQEKQNFRNDLRMDNTTVKTVFTPFAPTVTPSDPLFSTQLNLQLINAQKAWEITKGDSSVVVAVLDTGVDWMHPDLADNIWTNKAELNGKTGVDDDGNGYIDDIRGWDFVNNDNNPTDDNSHGTHVAGIIAARGDNGIGITGVNWYAKIMPVKVMQSTGRGDAATIAKGVEYAVAKGANIINLSLGGYYESLTLKSALENAYASCFIVAAAGNDGTAIGPCAGCAPLYPGAYSFVMGVQDQALYSNYDQDGPFASKYIDLLNYDTYAPGSSITSTIPNGGYAAYTGTSMSTPTVAGIASLYMSLNKNYDKELLFTQLIQQQTNGFVDAYKVLNNIPVPDLRVAKYEIVDTATGDNNNGRPDAGENINLRIYLKNFSAKADSVSIKVSYEGLADTSLVHFIQDSCFVGSISPNAVTFSQSPLNIAISNKVAHGADYKINVTIRDNKGNKWSSQVVITFQNAITLGGIITSDLTLYPNKYYNVTDNVILNGCKLIIKPGTILNFSQGKGLRTNNNGAVIALGKKDSVILFTSTSGWNGMQLEGAGAYTGSYIRPNGTWISQFDSLMKIDFSKAVDTIKNNSICKYCVVENLLDINGSNAYVVGGMYVNTTFRNNYEWYQIGWPSNGGAMPMIISSNFLNNRYVAWSYTFGYYRGYNNYLNNIPYIADGSSYSASGIGIQGFPYSNNYSTNVFNNSLYDLNASQGSNTLNIPSNWYLGTTDSLLISKHIYDYFDNSNYNAIIIQNYKNMPCDSCPGIVWKLTLDDKEFSSNTAQPEDVVEIGTHKIIVWFNRQMDTTITPVVTFGQRDPYNQISFKNKGVWAADGKSYSISREFVLTDPNGIVNFAVSAAKDTMGMEIPYERTRFRINLQSSASKSLDFNLTPQCGKLQLNWDNLKTPGSDIIGYNIYRRNKTAKDTFSLLNKTLVLDNAYKDYKVSLDSTYEYVYTAVRDGMNNETDSSYLLSGKPLASKLGDADGDSLVTVTDVVTTVNYILQKSPSAFIFKQADLNNDGKINVLDIIGIIDRILNPRIGGYTGSYDYNPIDNAGKLFLYKQNDTLFAKTVFKIGGIETNNNNAVNRWMGDLSKWETVKTPAGSRMLYSFGGSLSVPDALPIALINNSTDPSHWIVSTDDGRPLEIVWLGKLVENRKQQSANVILSEVAPNPAKDVIRFTVETKATVNNFNYTLTDMSGKEILKKEYGTKGAGISNETINVLGLSKGVYILKISWEENGAGFEKLNKVVLQ